MLILVTVFAMFLGGAAQTVNPPHVCARHVQPPTKYPPLWRLAQIEGTVTALLTMAPDGTIASIQTSGGHKVLQDTTRELLKHWTFQCSDCPANTAFQHQIVFDYKLLPERKSYDDSRVELDLPDRVTITASRPPINTNGAVRR